MTANNNEIKILGKYALNEVYVKSLEDSGKEGFFLEETDEQVFPTLWDEAFPFSSDGYAAVKDGELWGFINVMGELVVPYRWKDMRASQVSFPEGLCAVQDDHDLWGFINAKGEVILPCQWKDCRDFRNGECAVKDDKDLWSYIDKKGNFVRASKWKEIGEWSNEVGLCGVQDENGLWGFIDEKENLQIPCQWKETEWFDKTNDDDDDDNAIYLCWVKNQDDKWGCIDRSGRQVVAYEWSKEHRIFNDGLCAVQGENGLWGAINDRGVLVVPTEWDDDPFFSDGYSLVEKEGRLYKIDTQGKVIEDFGNDFGNDTEEEKKDDKFAIGISIILGIILAFIVSSYSETIGYAYFNHFSAYNLSNPSQWVGWFVALLGGLHTYDVVVPTVLSGGYLYKFFAPKDKFANCQPQDRSKQDGNPLLDNNSMVIKLKERFGDNWLGVLTFVLFFGGSFVGALFLPPFFLTCVLGMAVGCCIMLYIEKMRGKSDGITPQGAFGSHEAIIAFLLFFLSLRAVYFLLFAYNYHTAEEAKPTEITIVNADYRSGKSSSTYYLYVDIDNGVPYSLEVNKDAYEDYTSGKTSKVLADVRTGKLGFRFISDFKTQETVISTDESQEFTKDFRELMESMKK